MGVDDAAGARQLIHAGVAQQAVIDAFQAVQLLILVGDQPRPVECRPTRVPAVARRVFEILGEMGAVDEKLLRHAAAHDAGAADAHVFNHGRLHAVLAGGEARCADPAGAPADGDHVIVILRHCGVPLDCGRGVAL